MKPVDAAFDAETTPIIARSLPRRPGWRQRSKDVGVLDLMRRV